MRVIVTGDRGWDRPELASCDVKRLVSPYGRENLIIVHGAARGVDPAFDRAATLARVTKEPSPADWDRWGRRAGPIGNTAMVAKGAGLCIAFHWFPMISEGTRDSALQAIAAAR